MDLDANFPPLKNDLLLRAARGEPTERAPVWVMRQAGRYLPEFQEVRKDHEFFEVCRTPELATEVTLQPIRRYKGLLDAAIIFSDILVVPQAMGMEVLMNPGPFFPSPLTSPSDIPKMLKEKVDVNVDLKYVFDAISLTRKELGGEVPLIGFCGAPWTLFAYMIEGGGGSKSFTKAKKWLYMYPEESKELLMRIADVCADFLIGQVLAGAQLLQVFDSWASELSPHIYREFSLPSLRHISTRVRAALTFRFPHLFPPPQAGWKPKSKIPLTLFAKGANQSLSVLALEAGYDVLGLDWLVDPKDARQMVKVSLSEGHVTALQGNLDPDVLYTGREAIEREVKRMCLAFRSGGGALAAPYAWIANLGHGITPGVDPEDMRFFLECVHKYSSKGYVP
ncbi:uroporphyrinogen decarboxylase [Fomitiporia mediterranea MF3/22]|uniref:uroporphyrinogen decarboxylase n=1 Tax=Fomitiporia mediterranea (strain MF3/22) TaxID=694068 RepID=UPI000440952A|nr:uroporphyrinogen decarboxylase [Fomitiporia mediterranea MF3/22]EJD00842.1 uroporphyrinogen decarboxylase [Fomitiporia mediterranea MF3/22]